MEQAHDTDGSIKPSAIEKAGGYVAPTNGIPAGDLTSSVQASLAKADAAADNGQVVHLTGTETIAGAKNFTGGLNINGTAAVATNDARLTDQRTPVDGSVTNAKLSLTGGVNDQVLTKDSTQPGGFKWATVTAAAPWTAASVWSSSANYVPGPPANIVTYNGGSYIAIAPSNGTTPGTDTTKWLQLAAPGAAGPAGPSGINLRGAYNNSTTYGINDCVTYNGSAFYASAGTTGVNPGTPSAPNSPWVLLVSIGATGPSGSGGGAPYPSPADQNLIAWNYDPAFISVNTAPGAGVVFFARTHVLTAVTITNIFAHIATAGASLTANANYVGLYNSSGTLLATSADQSTNWTTTGLKTMPLTTAQSVAAGYYFLAILTNGTTIPSFSRAASAAPVSALNAGTTSTTPRQATYGSSQTALPATLVLTSSLTNNNVPWMAVN